ncbi:hypothetical protein H0S58_06525 [Acinetobacter sp. TTH0-4]|uniref:hypothetical protein n=1 Tax=Acinetobacter sp. TTH0-4 TaxID=1646498 RepID=UPI0018A033E1|nr:hypothetical protein [Acinetobacter sp. TTH0-4]QPF39125.1 hypothetical protein H0S58_06525 [Acinetobacter sp. TTH0-4]
MKNYIGYLEYKNVTNIPSCYVPSHEYIFFLHDNCAKILVEFESSNISEIGLDYLIDKYLEKTGNSDFNIIDILTYYKKNKLDAPYFHFLTSKILSGLIGDLLHFIYEALKNFEKRKFSVAYSLLRKPLKENLIFICWLFNNHENFIDLFEKETHKSLNNLREEKIKLILKETIDKLPLSEMFDYELLYKMIFSKKFSNGLEIQCQRATHLITSQGEFLKTKERSINSIFNNPFDDTNYDSIHICLPYIMLFTTHVILEAFNNLIKLNNNTYQHLLLVSIASYENLYVDGRKRLLTKSLSKQFQPLLNCIHCKKAIKIKKENSLKMFMLNHLICNSCNQYSEFPFYWLMAQMKISISQNNSDDTNIWKDTILSRMFREA